MQCVKVRRGAMTKTGMLCGETLCDACLFVCLFDFLSLQYMNMPVLWT